MLDDPGLLQSELLPSQKATAGSSSCRRHSNTQKHVWLSLCRFSGYWCAQGFVSALQTSLACMGFNSKHEFSPPTVFLGRLLFYWMWGIFFGGIQHSSVNCPAASCSFGVLTGDNECMSFYSSILSSPAHQNKTSFTQSQSLPSGSFHKPLTLIHQRAERMKTTVTEN